MIVAISGPHGAGKTTLVGDAATSLGVPEIERAPSPRVNSDSPFERTLRFANRYAAEFDRIAALNPHRPALVQRCSVDQYVYADAFFALGWITPAQHAILRDRIAPLVDRALHAYTVAVLLPPIEALREMLARRITRAGAKWREADTDYLDAVHAAFTAFGAARVGDPRLQVLTTVDRDARVDALGRILAPRLEMAS